MASAFADAIHVPSAKVDKQWSLPANGCRQVKGWVYCERGRRVAVILTEGVSDRERFHVL